MNQSILKPIFYIILVTIVLSCANSKNHKNKSAFRLIKKEKLVNYKLLSYASQFDTVLVVAKNCVKEKYIEENLIYISLQGNNKIDVLNDNGEEISFVYYSKGGENNNLKILTGSGSPGSSKTQIISYNSFPYFIENCSD